MKKTLPHIYCMNIEEVNSALTESVKRHFPARYEKAQRYRFKEDRARCIGAGVLLRELTRLEENDIWYNEYGKPYTHGNSFFSLSHGGSSVVLATDDTPIGVDIEQTDKDYMDICSQVFTKNEIEYIKDNKERFFEIWTLKESLAKAVGEGLHLPVKESEVLPFLQNKPVRWQGNEWYGYTQRLQNGEYILSCVTTKKTRPEVTDYIPQDNR